MVAQGESWREAPDEPIPVSRSVCRALATLLFLLVPLAALPTLGDAYVSPKWHVLEGLVLAWALAEAFVPAQEMPSTWIRLSAAAGLSLLSPLRILAHGLSWFAPLLLDRVVVLVLPLLFWRAARRGDLVGPVRRGLMVSVPLVSIVVLAEALGVDAFWLFGSGDHRSATFGNVNLAAEFLGFALVTLVALGSRGRRFGGLAELSSVLALASVLLLGTRSVALGLVVAATLLVLRRDVSPRVLARLGLGAIAVLLGLVLLSSVAGSLARGGSLGDLLPPSGHSFDASGRAHKAASSSLRFAAWRSSLLLIRDEPLGVGPGGFEHAFIPYQLTTSPAPSEALWFRSPHNELLRLAVEEGLPSTVALLAILLSLVRTAWRRRELCREVGWLVASGALLGSQCLLQFPLQTGCGALFAALWLALLVDATHRPVNDEARKPAAANGHSLARYRGLGSALVAAAVLSSVVAGAVVLRRSIRANVLLGEAGGRLLPTREACELDPRNAAACVNTAWLEATAGDASAALKRTQHLLRSSPHYFPAIKLLGDLRIARGEIQAGCEDLALYERLFHGHGRATETLDTHCPPDTRLRSTWRVPSLFWHAYPGLP